MTRWRAKLYQVSDADVLVCTILVADTAEQGIRRALNERLPNRETWIELEEVEELVL